MAEPADPAAATSPAPATTATEPVVVVQQPGSSWLTWIGWTGFIFCGLALLGGYAFLYQYFDTTGGLTEKYESGPQFSGDKIAIIEVSGPILSGEGYVKNQIERVRSDPSVKAVVLRIDSPGGTVSASDYIYHHLVELRKERDLPIVVSMGSMATSGGYYIAMAAGDNEDVIYAETTTTTGSIGVIIPYYNVSGLLEQCRIEDQSIASHPNKQMLSMTRPLGEEQKRLIRRYLDAAFERFKEVVLKGRPELTESELNDLATGEIFAAGLAREKGLVDKIGFLEDAIARAIKLADLEPEDARVVRYPAPPSVLSAVGLAETRKPESRFETLVDAAAPRAYYMTTTLPVLVDTYRGR